MSFDVNWDIDKYREDHESDEHWQLRRNFMERWQSSYPEERLVCLARVFANMEFMGCRYPQEVMQEVARMSKEVNRGVTYNNNFANLSAFDGQYVAQDTESATSETTNSDKNQDSSENQYVWSSYTSEVMQGPVSISKVLRTEHLKSIIRENSPNLRMGSSLNKFPRMDLSSQSNLSEFIDDSIETVKTYPGNVAKYQKSSDSVWTRASNKPNIQEMQTPQAGINTSDLQYQNLSQADNYMSHPVVNPQQFNDTDMRCMQVTYNNYMPRPVVDAQQFNDTDMRCMQVIQSGPYQEHTNFDRSSYQQGKPSSLGANTLENQAQNYWSQPVCSTGLTNLQNPTNQANIAIRLSNIAANTSNIVTSNYTPASNIDAYVNNVHTPAPQDSNIDVEAGKIRVKQKQSKKRTWKKRHGNAEARRYRYWIDAGKSKSEAKRLSTIKLSKVPEYKEIKKEMGSVRKHCRESFIASQQQKLNKRLNMNNFIGNKYKYVKPPEEKKLGDGEKNKTGTDTTVNALSNTATVTSMNKTPITSNIPASVSNITVSTNNTNAENSVSAFTSSGNICSPVSDINSLTNDAKGTSRKSRKDNWIETQQNKIHMESISHLPPEEKPLVKQLKDTTKATMLKLAYKDKFKQRLTNTQNSNQYLNIESNTVIEITDDEADAENNAKVKEEIEKDMQLKNRKTEEEAIFLCQIPMPSSDAEKVPKQDVTKDLQEKNLPVEVNEQHSNVTDASQNTRADLLHGNIGRCYNEINNVVGISNAFLAEHVGFNRSNPETQSQTKSTNSAHIEYTGNPAYCNMNSTTKYTNHTYISNVGNTINLKKIYTKTPNSTVVLEKTSNIKEFKIYVKDAKKEFAIEEVTLLQNEIAECIDSDDVKFLRVSKLGTYAVVKCGDEYSRDWLDKQIPTLMPWAGAQLIILDESDIPVYFNAWLYVPDVPEITIASPEEFIKVLHEQNDKIGCDKWKVLHAQTQKEGKLHIVRFESKSEKLLQRRGFRLNWFSAPPLKVQVKRKKTDVNKKNAIPLTKKNAKKQLNTKNAPNQKKLTTQPPKKKKKAKNPNTKPVNKLSNQSVKVYTPAPASDIKFASNLHTENNSVNKVETDTPLVYGSVIRKEENLNAFKMAGTSETYYPTHSIHSQPSSSHASETHLNDLRITIPNEYSNTTDQAKVVPLDNAHQVLAEKRTIYESVTVQVANDVGKDNINLGELRSSAVHNVTEVNRVPATEAWGRWGVDTPRMLPEYRSAMTIKTDHLDCDDPQNKINFMKIGSFDPQKQSDDRDYNFLDIFTGRDEEFSLEERVFVARKTLLQTDRVIPRDDRVLKRDDRIPERNENYLRNRNLKDEDFYERGTVHSSRDISENRERYSQDDTRQTQESFDEITTSDDKNPQRPEYSRDNTYSHRENPKEDYANDERHDSWEDTDMDEDFQQEYEERDRDERSQRYPEVKNLEDWRKDSRNTQDLKYDSYHSEERYRTNRSAERGDHEHSRPSVSNSRYFGRTDDHHKNREYERDRSQNAHSRQFLSVKERLGPRIETDKRHNEPDEPTQFDSRSDTNVDVPMSLKQLNHKRKRARRRARQREREGLRQ